jgi:hypothetical protein
MANMAMLVRSCNVLLSFINEYIKQFALYAYNSIKHDTRDSLKVPKREIFDRLDFPDFNTIKSLRMGDFGVKIKKCLKNI